MENSNNVNVLADVANVTHHQGDIRYGATTGIQCSCMSLKSICWSILNWIVMTLIEFYKMMTAYLNV